MNANGRFEYSLFAIRKWRFERVLYPDGTREDVPTGEGDNKAEQWSRARFDEQELPALQARFEAEHDVWNAGYRQWRQYLTITERVVKTRASAGSTRIKRPALEITDDTRYYAIEPDSLTNTSTYHTKVGRVRSVSSQIIRAGEYTAADNTIPLPNGHEIAYASSFEAARQLLATSYEVGLKQLYTLENPEPTLPDKQAYTAWKAAQAMQPEVLREQRGWMATLYTPSGSEPIMIDGEWKYGWPETDIVNILNKTGADGWQVISVTEDKGLYSGHDASSESGPTAVRYLLARPRQ
jgi:hypothetical protein